MRTFHSCFSLAIPVSSSGAKGVTPAALLKVDVDSRQDSIAQRLNYGARGASFPDAVSSGETGPGRPASSRPVIVARGSAATPPPSSPVPPRHNRGTTQEGGQTVDARGIIGTAGVRAERPRRGKSVQRMHLPRIRWLFEYIRSPLPCPSLRVLLSPVFSLPPSLRLVRTHAIFARDLMPPELCAPYLCTERVYTRLALATGETVKAPVPTISYSGRQAPGPRALAPPCIRTSRILWSLGARRRY